MFSRRLLSVANMDPRYMAEFDGSEKAAGRGSGKTDPPNWREPLVKPKIITPYMNMAFAPMERRLDIAIFRAMFASSARQARQFCIHGAVKVNGKKVSVSLYPRNRLNMVDESLTGLFPPIYRCPTPDTN
jgi:ribosomal protein S4